MELVRAKKRHKFHVELVPWGLGDTIRRYFGRGIRIRAQKGPKPIKKNKKNKMVENV